MRSTRLALVNMVSRRNLSAQPVRQQLGRALIAMLVIGSGGALFSTACTNGRQEEPKPVADPATQPVIAGSNSPATAKAPIASAVGALAIAAVPATAEERLLRVLQLVEWQELDAALQAAAELTEDIPNFLAAQLVYADLLRFKTGRHAGLAASPGAGVTELPARKGSFAPNAVNEQPLDWKAQMKGLRKELERRVHGSSFSPPADSIPREFQRLGASVRHALAVDASKSRLYLFSHEKGKLRLIADFYVSVGKLGMGKSQEGDQRTPQGVYFVGRQIAGAKLPDFYGKGALTLNYPNDWDKTLDRSGDGIWLHGSPPDQFARLPEASDGCIVLANTDLITLMKSVDRQTPVLLSDKLQWETQSQPVQAKAADSFVPVLDAWQQAWSRADQRMLASMYVQDLASESSAKARLKEFFRFPDVALQNLSVYAWKDPQGEIRIVDAQIGSKKAGKLLPLRQYWRKSGARWEIFSEEVRG